MAMEKDEIIYRCNYKGEEWYGVITNYKNYSTFSECEIRGRGSYIKMYIGNIDDNLWVSFPIQKKATTLSRADDTYWNEEELTGLFESIVDGITISQGIKKLDRYNLIREAEIEEYEEPMF